MLLSGSCGNNPRLACPFWKKNPVQHQACFSLKLSRISDVKQHLRRKHTPDRYCQRCFLIFKNEQGYQAHRLSFENCRARPNERLDGIDTRQAKRLGFKSKSGDPVPQQWYAIWRILFDDLREPDSPYIDSSLSRDAQELNQFYQQQGSRVVAEILYSNFSTLQTNSPHDLFPRLHDIVRTALQSAGQKYRPSSSVTSSESPSPPPTTSWNDTHVIDTSRVDASETDLFGVVSGPSIDYFGFNSQYEQVGTRPGETATAPDFTQRENDGYHSSFPEVADSLVANELFTGGVDWGLLTGFPLE